MNINSDCFFCNKPIYKMSNAFPWIDGEHNEYCQFHPIAYDIMTLEDTGLKAPHLDRLDIIQLVRKAYEKPNLRAVDDNVVSIAKKAKKTSQNAAKKVLPHTGTLRRKIFDYIVSTGGATDFVLEAYLGLKHQSVSAARRSLVVDGFLKDSGKVATNSSGNDCIVWVMASREETLFG